MLWMFALCLFASMFGSVPRPGGRRWLRDLRGGLLQEQ